MVNGTTYEEQTLARLNEFRAKQKQAQFAAEQKLKEAKYFGDYADTLEKILGLESQRNEFTQIGAEQVSKSSTWKTLESIMLANKGMLVVVDAVSFLVDMKVYTDREQARHAIYSTLHNHKKDAIRVERGIYRLRNVPATENLIHLEKQVSLKKRGSISFESGVRKVLQDAHGEPLNNDEIWRQIQVLGVISNAKDPAGWIDWHARNLGAEKVAPHSWRWKEGKKSEQTTLQIGIPSVQSVISPTTN